MQISKMHTLAIKSLIIGLFFLCIGQTVNAQFFSKFERGVRVDFGLGKVSSSKLRKHYANLGANDAYDQNSNAHSSFGLGFGIGFYVAYQINDDFSVLSESSLNYQTSTIYINHVRDSSIGLANGMRHRISSQGRLKEYYFSQNFLARYKLGENKRWAILAGPIFSLSINPMLKSREEEIYTIYKNQIIFDTQINNTNQKVMLNKSGLFRLAFAVGVEKKMRRKLKNVTVGTLASYSLFGSKMGTSSNVFNTSGYNNQIFSKAAVVNGPAINGNLNDFHALKVEFFIRYKLFNAAAPAASTAEPETK